MTQTRANQTTSGGTSVLQTYLYRTVLENFEPNLEFYKLGSKPTATDGYNTVAWARFDTISEDSITEGSTADDGTTPDDTNITASMITSTPVQYRVVVTISDMVAELNVINFIEGAGTEVGSAMARKIDQVIQTTVMAGDNVVYGGDATSRATLASGDVLTVALFNQADAKLRDLNSPTFSGGMYVCVIHPFQLYDLRATVAVGAWLDSAKYAKPEEIFKGEVGALMGVRIVISSNVNTFASTVTVYPALVLGKGAYGVADFQTLKTYYVPFASSESDPLAQRSKVGSKVSFATKRLQEDSMVRVETSATSL